MKRMQSPTLLRLMLLGLLIVTLPLIVAIITAIAEVDRLARDSRRAMVTVQQNTSTSRALADRVSAMERSARQYHALADDTYKDLYNDHRRVVLALFNRLSKDTRNLNLQARLKKARASEVAANTLVETIGGGASVGDLEKALSALRENVLEVVQAQNSIARDMANAMPEHAGRLQRTLVGRAALVIPLSVVLAILFAVLIARPLRQIDRGIRSLGRGALRETVRVSGTRDLEELGQRLDWLRLRLVELEAQKSQFLRNVSHELKTPLTNIREGAELLLDENTRSTDPERYRVTQIVRDNSVRLQQMIEELLRYGAEGDFAGQQMDESVRFDRLVHDAIEKYARTVEARSVTVTTSLKPTVVIGNSKRLQVIVDNLLSNAVKYTPHGGLITIELKSNDGVVTLGVRDSGPGIPKKHESLIFEWFYTGPRPAKSIVAGTGMGLAIAQEYAQQHDGQISLVESMKGAHFLLTIGKKVMMNRGILAAGILFLAGCVTAPSPLCVTAPSPAEEWLRFADGVNDLSPRELSIARDETSRRHARQPDDDSRLRLSYVLSRPNPSTQDLAISRELLAEIDSGSNYAPLRDWLNREIGLIAKLQAARLKVDKLLTQLEALKAIETDITEGQKAIDELSK